MKRLWQVVLCGLAFVGLSTLAVIALILLDGIFDRSLEPLREQERYSYVPGSGLPKSGGSLPNQVPPSTGIHPPPGPPVVIPTPGSPGLNWILQPDGSFAPVPRYDTSYRLENSGPGSKYEPRYEYPLYRPELPGQQAQYDRHPPDGSFTPLPSK